MKCRPLSSKSAYWSKLAHAGASSTVSPAVAAAAAAATAGETVLLAPACASFDQYADFEERGRHFMEIVGRMREKAR